MKLDTITNVVFAVICASIFALVVHFAFDFVESVAAASKAGTARIDEWNRQEIFCADHGYTETRWLHEHVYCYKLLNGSDVLVKIEDVK